MSIAKVHEELKRIKEEKKKLIERQKEIKNELDSTKKDRQETRKLRADCRSNIERYKKEIRNLLRSLDSEFLRNNNRDECDGVLENLRGATEALGENVHDFFYGEQTETFKESSSDEQDNDSDFGL